MVALLLLLTACSKDEGGQAGQSEVEVCVFFAPGELGDQGFADRLRAGLYQFEEQLSENDRNKVRVRYVSGNDTSVIKNELHHWDSQNISPFTRKAYERRLLVLTDPLLPLLQEVTLAPADEVLVTNVSDKRFEQMPRYAELGSRLHLLSISAAEAARKICQMSERSATKDAATQKQLYLLTQSGDNDATADSIGIVLADYTAAKPEMPFVKLSKQTTEGVTITLDQAYQYAHLLPFNVSTEEYSCYVVCAWGMLNTALSTLILNNGLGTTQTTFLDTEYPAMQDVCHNIVRHYDRALQQWLSRWLNAPSASMPAKEWHGAWDGYVTDDF